MKKIYLFTLVSMNLAIEPLVAQSFNPNLALKLQHKLDSMVTAFAYAFAYNTPGLSAGVYVPGQGMWRGASGISHTAVPLTPQMQLGIASNTKLFTAVTMLKLAEDTIISLNDSLKKWLPTYPNVNPNITIRQLLNHTSGISDPFFTTGLLDTIRKYPSKVYTPTELLTWLGPKAYNPGVGYQYSNLNYVLAGMIAKVATGKELSKLTRDYILNPLQLDSTFCDIQEPVNGIMAHRHVKMVDMNDTSRVALSTAGASSGYIFSNTGDMLKWYNALMSGQVLTPTSYKELTTFALPGNYGLGLQKTTFYSRTTWGHAGALPGYKSRMVYDTAMKVIVCGLSNDDYSAIDAITVTLYKVVLDLLPLNAGVISGPTTICQNTNSITYTVAPISNALSYSWTLPKGVTGTSTTNSITVNYTDSAISGNITVSGLNSYGAGYPFNLNITVNPLPSSNGSIIGLASVCPSQDSVQYVISPLNNATTYQWQLPSGATGNSNTNAIYVHYLPNASNGNISVKGNNNCGAGKTISYAVTMKQLPSKADSISGPIAICLNQGTASYSVAPISNATSYLWSFPSGFMATQDSTVLKLNITDSAKSGLMVVKGLNSCGSGVTFSLPITVKPLPMPASAILGDSSVCQDQKSITYSTPTIPNALSYEWILPSGTSGSSNTNSIVLNFTSQSQNNPIRVSGVNGCGNGLSSIKNIEVKALPVKPGLISGPSNICAGSDSVTYFTPNVLHATSYQWQLSNGLNGTSNSNAILIKFAPNAKNGKLIVNGKNACGNGDTLAKNIEILPLPDKAGDISGLNMLCVGKDSVLYAIPAIQNVNSYQWTLPKYFNGESYSNSINISFDTMAISNVIKVSGLNSCGSGEPAVYAIQVNPLPAEAGVISGPPINCSGSASIGFSVSKIKNATNYVWLNNMGAIIVPPVDSLVQFKFPNPSSGLIKVKGVNACGSGRESFLAVRVNATPAQPIVTYNNGILHSNATDGNQWHFQNASIAGANSQDFKPVANGNYFTIVTSDGCSSAPSDNKLVILTGLSKIEKHSYMEIYPLPFDDELHFHRSDNKSTDITLMNTIGQVVYQGRFDEKDMVVDTKQLAGGVYYIKVDNSEWKRVICNK